jgi:predicted DNA-binding protein (MmcQ/YjbR family)
MFGLVNIEPPFFINLKCDPEKAVELREMHEQILPGYHMNKAHWNSVYFEDGLKTSLVKSLIDDSYNLIVAGLPKKIKKELE